MRPQVPQMSSTGKCLDTAPIYAAVPCQSQDGSVAYSWVTVDSRTFLGASSAVAEEQTYENTEPTYFTAETRLQPSSGTAGERSDYVNVEGLLKEAQQQSDKDTARKSGTLNGLVKNEQFATIVEEDEDLPSCSLKVGPFCGVRAIRIFGMDC